MTDPAPTPSASIAPAGGRPPLQLWDVDLLLGRDPVADVRVDEADLRGWVGPVVRSGVLGSLRALAFDAASGNAEVAETALALGLVPALALETRDWLGARDALDAAPAGTIVRLAPQRQDCQPSFPGFRAIVRVCAERGFPVLAEGDVRAWGPAYAGLGLRVVFLDAHFYHLGDFVSLAADEPGFAASTRLLNGPDSLAIVVDELGVDRLVFGSRTGFHEGSSAVSRLVTSALGETELVAAASGTLRRLLGVAA